MMTGSIFFSFLKARTRLPSNSMSLLKTLYIYLLLVCVVFLCGDIGIVRKKSTFLVDATRTYLPACSGTVTNGQNMGALNLALTEVEEVYVGGARRDPETLGYVWKYTGTADTSTLMRRIVTSPGSSNDDTDEYHDEYLLLKIEVSGSNAYACVEYRGVYYWGSGPGKMPEFSFAPGHK